MDGLSIGKRAIYVEDQGVHGPVLSLVHAATIAETDAGLNSENLWTPIRHPLLCRGEHAPRSCGKAETPHYFFVRGSVTKPIFVSPPACAAAMTSATRS